MDTLLLAFKNASTFLLPKDLSFPLPLLLDGVRIKVISVSKLVLVLNCSPESSLFAKLCEYVCIRLIEISFSRNTIFSERASTRHVEALSLKMVFLFLWFGMFDTGERVSSLSVPTDLLYPGSDLLYPLFDQFIPNPLVDSYPRNYDTKCLKQT